MTPAGKKKRPDSSPDKESQTDFKDKNRKKDQVILSKKKTAASHAKPASQVRKNSNTKQEYKNNSENAPLDIGTIERWLWESANILRGPVDAADFKTYIFPLLFFKRISDAYDEETALALKRI